MNLARVHARSASACTKAAVRETTAYSEFSTTRARLLVVKRRGKGEGPGGILGGNERNGRFVKLIRSGMRVEF